MKYFLLKIASGAAGMTILFLVVAPFLAGAGTASAQVQIPTDPNAPIKTRADIVGFFNNILRIVATMFWIAAVIFFFYAAFLYLTAAGNDQKVSKAKIVLIYGLIAVAIGLMAYGMPLLVSNFLKGV